MRGTRLVSPDRPDESAEGSLATVVEYGGRLPLLIRLIELTPTAEVRSDQGKAKVQYREVGNPPLSPRQSICPERNLCAGESPKREDNPYRYLNLENVGLHAVIGRDTDIPA